MAELSSLEGQLLIATEDEDYEVVNKMTVQCVLVLFSIEPHRHLIFMTMPMFCLPPYLSSH